MLDNRDFSPPDSDIDRQIRIDKMRHELDEIAAGNMFSGSFGPVPPNIEEAFLKQAFVFERAELDTDFNRLLKRGVVMVPPPELDDTALSAKLREVIRALAEMRCFLHDTDHLN